MADTILEVWKNQGKGRDDKGLEYVKEHFDAKRMVRDLETVYNNIIYG